MGGQYGLLQRAIVCGSPLQLADTRCRATGLSRCILNGELPLRGNSRRGDNW
jgi:hypothetical protein